MQSQLFISREVAVLTNHHASGSKLMVICRVLTVFSNNCDGTTCSTQCALSLRYNVANTSHGNLAELEEAEDIASEAQAMKPLPRRPVGLTSEKPTRSESTQLDDDVFSGAIGGMRQTSAPSAAATQGQAAGGNEHKGIGVDYTPSSYFASRAASGALDSHADDGINRQSSHLNLQDLNSTSK